jgi:hypothetical protein
VNIHCITKRKVENPHKNLILADSFPSFLIAIHLPITVATQSEMSHQQPTHTSDHYPPQQYRHGHGVPQSTANASKGNSESPQTTHDSYSGRPRVYDSKGRLVPGGHAQYKPSSRKRLSRTPGPLQDSQYPREQASSDLRSRPRYHSPNEQSSRRQYIDSPVQSSDTPHDSHVSRRATIPQGSHIPLTEEALQSHAAYEQASNRSATVNRTADQRPPRGRRLPTFLDDAEDVEDAWRKYNDTSASQYHKRHAPIPKISEPAPIPAPTAQSARTTKIADTANTANTAKAPKPARRTNKTRTQRGRLLGGNYGDDPRD